MIILRTRQLKPRAGKFTAEVITPQITEALQSARPLRKRRHRLRRQEGNDLCGTTNMWWRVKVLRLMTVRQDTEPPSSGADSALAAAVLNRRSSYGGGGWREIPTYAGCITGFPSHLGFMRRS